uniref:Large ribosomal subunit protein bL32m n=1 Tax=Cannabis sativa TaxID=3483 RepID=A0A803R2L6_CANSA
MAFRMLMLRSAGGKISSLLGLRWSHGAAIPGPLDGLIDRNVISPQMVLPEASLEDSYNNKNIGFGFPIFSFGGSMELMAVPKRKTSPHKRGIRNGPKALKPTPVIVRWLWSSQIVRLLLLQRGQRQQCR